MPRIATCPEAETLDLEKVDGYTWAGFTHPPTFAKEVAVDWHRMDLQPGDEQ